MSEPGSPVARRSSLASLNSWGRSGSERFDTKQRLRQRLDTVESVGLCESAGSGESVDESDTRRSSKSSKDTASVALSVMIFQTSTISTTDAPSTVQTSENMCNENQEWTVKHKAECLSLETLRQDYELEHQGRARPSDSDSDQESGAEKTLGSTPEPIAQEAGASDTPTTLMVRGLDPSLTKTDFVQHFLDEGYAGFFDFVYMPMNFRAPGTNFGYAFINFKDHAVGQRLIMKLTSAEYHSAFQGWSATWSSTQGWSDNIERYRNSPLMHRLVPAESQPAVFDQHGCQVAFPKPTKTIPRPRVQTKATAIRGPSTAIDSYSLGKWHLPRPQATFTAGYLLAPASPPTFPFCEVSSDSALTEQEPQHFPGRSRRRPGRKR